jgi:hypothetical protein
LQLSQVKLPSVHCAGLLDVWGASQNILLADTGIHWQTEGHSFSQSVSQSVLHRRVLYSISFFLLCSVLCLACVKYNLEQRMFIYDCYVGEKKLVQIVQEKILH